MKHFRFMVLALCFFLSSCGGGGSAQKDTHGIRLLASSLDLAPLSLFSDLEGVTLPQNVPFGRLSERVPLASSSYNIRLAEHYNPERVLKVVSFDAEAQGAYSLWVFGSSAQLQIQLLPDRTLELESNMSAIRFLNGTQDSSSAVLNLVGDSNYALTGNFGEAGGYMQVNAGIYSATYSLDGGSASALPDVEFLEGQSYTVILEGEKNLFVTGSVKRD